MKCPFCGSRESKVIDSRAVQKESAIRRRRECLSCKHRFTTYEYIVEYPLMVVKNDGRREEYNRQKVFNSIKIACNKRPVSIESIEFAVNEIEKEIEIGGYSEISSKLIGELVMRFLRKLDEVAYIRFASVYRKFQDIEEFRNHLEQMRD